MAGVRSRGGAVPTPTPTPGQIRFLLTLAFIPSDGRALSQLSLMPDHLIGIGTGVMAVSRTFAWWSTCAICVICVNAKRSYCPSSSRTCSQYHSHAFYSHILSLPHISTWFRARHATKKASGSGGNHGDQHVDHDDQHVVNRACHCFRIDKR